MKPCGQRQTKPVALLEQVALSTHGLLLQKSLSHLEPVKPGKHWQEKVVLSVVKQLPLTQGCIAQESYNVSQL